MKSLKWFFMFIWLDMARFYWTAVYAMSTKPGQILPETPTQTNLYMRAMSATLDVQSHLGETR